MIDWCYESNVYYEGEILQIKNYYMCARLCENEPKCTAFIHHRRELEVDQSNSSNTNRTQRIYISNCTLMVNVTKTIPRKFKSRKSDNLVSGKKCKDYDPFRKTLDAGNVYKNGGCLLLFKLLLNILVRINSTICFNSQKKLRTKL